MGKLSICLQTTSGDPALSEVGEDPHNSHNGKASASDDPASGRTHVDDKNGRNYLKANDDGTVEHIGDAGVLNTCLLYTSWR